jgi:hypothetical protein
MSNSKSNSKSIGTNVTEAGIKIIHLMHYKFNDFTSISLSNTTGFVTS